MLQQKGAISLGQKALLAQSKQVAVTREQTMQTPPAASANFYF